MTQNAMSIFCCSVEASANVGQASRLSRTCPRASFSTAASAPLAYPCTFGDRRDACPTLSTVGS
jgi:hypothetical protein